MVKDDDYIPIDCAIYSQFELHIMHNDSLKMSWNDESGLTHVEVIKPIDLRSTKQGEFMHANSSDNKAIKIRLDKIIKFSKFPA